MEFIQPVSLRWSDIDPNYHVRHSVYYDWGAKIRTDFLNASGLTLGVMQENNFGPVLFREECVFRKEIRYGDEISIDFNVLKLRKDFARFSMQHQIIKKDGTLCAILTVDGAWMDTKIRKLTVPPQIGIEIINKLPKCHNFEWTEVAESSQK
ncbi:MAG: acyl-CoA thioesterase [Bacteroidota bacterium]|nr:acyl-CoA thioesterase [Bacteroidota bacterium]